MSDAQLYYDEWLQGRSLRQIASKWCVGRAKVYDLIRKTYGRDACSIRKQSLARHIYQEYGDLEQAKRAIGIEGLYHSAKTEAMYTRHKFCPLDIEIEYEEPEYRPPMRMCLVCWMLTRIVENLAELG